MLKKITVSILFLALVFSLAACVQPNPNAKAIIGKWSTPIDILKAADLGDEFAALDSKLELDLQMEFKDDGNFEFSFDKDGLRVAYDGFIDDVFEYFETVMLSEQLEAKGLTYEEAIELLGEDFLAKIRSELEKSVDIDQLTAGIGEDSGIYKVTGDKLFLVHGGDSFDDADYAVIEISGDTLTLVSSTNPNFTGDLFSLPCTFTKTS